VKKSMMDAAGLIREATPIYQEVGGAMDSAAGGQARSLRSWPRRPSGVNVKLGDARILYASVKADAPDPTVVDRRVAQLDELLARCRSAQEDPERLE
jgi:hypothetical protein